MNTQQLFRFLRIQQWTKNCFLFAAPLFGGKLFSLYLAPNILLAFFSFSLCASAGYILNDIADRERDRQHPKKSIRPIAAGLISLKKAYLTAIALFILSLFIGIVISPFFIFFLGSYVFLQIYYTYWGRNMTLVDIFLIAAGFVIRVFAGAEATAISISQWLFICVFLLSLVLGAGKRISELKELQELAKRHRSSLDHYTPRLLQGILIVSSYAAMLFYGLYAITQSPRTLATLPLVAFGLFRYFMLVKHGEGDPTSAALHDRQLRTTVLVWIVAIVLINYNVYS